MDGSWSTSYCSVNESLAGPFASQPIAMIKSHVRISFKRTSFQFLPESNDTLVASGAADSRVELHDLVSGDSLHVYTSHFSRVKRIEVARDAPHLIWSAAEDGLVL